MSEIIAETIEEADGSKEISPRVDNVESPEAPPEKITVENTDGGSVESQELSSVAGNLKADALKKLPQGSLMGLPVKTDEGGTVAPTTTTKRRAYMLQSTSVRAINFRDP